MSIFSTRFMILFFFLSLQNTSASGGINVTTTPIYTLCGNSIKEGPEICDDGTSNGVIGHCNLHCNGTSFYNNSQEGVSVRKYIPYIALGIGVPFLLAVGYLSFKVYKKFTVIKIKKIPIPQTSEFSSSDHLSRLRIPAGQSGSEYSSSVRSSLQPSQYDSNSRLSASLERVSSIAIMIPLSRPNLRKNSREKRSVQQTLVAADLHDLANIFTFTNLVDLMQPVQTEQNISIFQQIQAVNEQISILAQNYLSVLRGGDFDEDGLKIITQELRQYLREIHRLLNYLILIEFPDHIFHMQDSAVEAMEILDGILDHASSTGGDFKITRQRRTISQLMDHIISSFRSYVLSKNIEIEQIISDPNTGVTCDPILIKRVLRNLLSNAIKFTPIGGVIVIRVHVSVNSVTFEIEDTGPGISEEDRSKLFQAYSQIRPDELQNGGGHGLGLWISQLIINAHGSQIEILPAYHGGSIFRFSLQAAEPRGGVFQQEEYRQVTNPLTLFKSDTSISI